MPQFNRRELDERSRQYGFNRDTFEKADTADRFQQNGLLESAVKRLK
jgi:hypothetical protein